MLKLAEAQPFSFVLESVTGGEVRGRYSIVGMRPDLIWECRGETRVNRQARFDETDFETMTGSPLDTLRRILAESRISKMIRPDRILEVGTFTGYSAICLAAGLNPGGKLISIETNDELRARALEFFVKAGVEDKID